MKEVLKVSSSSLPEQTRVAGFRGTEGISTLYEFDLYLLMGAEGNDLDLADAVGVKATLELDRVDGRPPFVFHGIFAAFELLHEFGDRSLFHAVLVPQLWQLTQTSHSRMFTNQSIPDIIKEVLEDSGLSGSDYELKLAQDYKPQEHVCQYRESNFDFISRWMEREGMYYYFEQGDDAEKLVITDSKSFQGPLEAKAVRFFALGGHDGSAGEALHKFTCKHRALPASVKLTDYDYTKPTLDVSGTAPVSRVGIGEISVYGDRFFSPDQGKRLSKTRAEELLARQVVYRGAGTAWYLRPGYLFELEDHPRPGFDMKYLATQVEHRGNQAITTAEMRELTGIEDDRVYWVEVVAIPAAVQYRPESRTAWPRIYGYENGTICGPIDSDYAQIDEYGRYNVKFKFDESDLKDGKASTWVRMMQPHGGDIEGFHFPLRKGTEVVFSFLGGDPDRPVINGVVPNLHTPSPVTKGNHTKNVIQTGGRNRWELEDKKGQERITMSTPYSNTYLRMGSPNDGHELIVKTDDNTLLDAGKNFDLTVGQNGGGSWNAKIHDDWITHVQTGKHELWVDAGTSLTTVKGDTTLHVLSGNHTTNVDSGGSFTHVKGVTSLTVDGASYDVKVTAGNTTVNTQGTTTIQSHGTLTLQTDAACDVKVKSDMTLTVDGGLSKEVKGAETLKTFGPFKKLYQSNNINITGGIKSDTFLGLSNTNAVGATIGTFIGGKVTLEASGAFSATYSYKFEIAGGVAMSYKFGAALNINSAVELTVKPTHIETGAAKISQLPTRLAMTALRYKLSGVHVLS